MSGVAVVLAGFSLITALLAWSRWLARRRLAALGHVVMAIVAGWGALLAWQTVSSLGAYEPVVRGHPIAEIFFEQTGSRSYRAMLTRLPSGRVQVFEMTGDQWRLEARTLDWHGWAAGVGMRPVYRLEHLSARHVRPLAAGDPAASRYALDTDTGDDVWAKARTNPAWRRFASARLADGPWQPMLNGARYVVRLQDAALKVEPGNDVASRGTPPAG